MREREKFSRPLCVTWGRHSKHEHYFSNWHSWKCKQSNYVSMLYRSSNTFFPGVQRGDTAIHENNTTHWRIKAEFCFQLSFYSFSSNCFTAAACQKWFFGCKMFSPQPKIQKASRSFSMSSWVLLFLFQWIQKNVVHFTALPFRLKVFFKKKKTSLGPF